MAIIKAIAHLNELTKDVDNDYYLTPEVKGSLTLEDIVARLKAREVATQNVNGLAFTQLVLDEIAKLVAEGYNVNTSLFRASLSLKGSVLAEELGHPIAASRLNIAMNFAQGDAAREAIRGISVEVFEQSAATGPVIQSITDPTEGSNGHLNPGCMVLIQGKRLAIKGDDPSCGVLFTYEINPEKTVFIPASKIYPNTPSKLQFALPEEVVEGPWKVKVTTQFAASGVLVKYPRTSESIHIMNGSAI